MKALVFAAGLGTRLKPLTDTMPKALVQVGGLPLLEIAIQKLSKVGVTDFIINIHHFAEKIEEFIAHRPISNLKFTFSDERELLLDTGGGLKKAADFFKDESPFFIYNADIINTLDLKEMYSSHIQSKADVTLSVMERESSRKLLFDKNSNLVGWKNILKNEYRWTNQPISDYTECAFSGIHILNPSVLQLLPKDKTVFSMIDFYLEIGSKVCIKPYCKNDATLIDVGKPETLALANQLFASQNFL